MNLSYFIDKLLHGGDKNLRGYEVATLAAFRENLNTENVHKFDEQIKKLTKVQRWQGGKTTAFFDYLDEMKDTWPNEISFFDNDEKGGVVARITLMVGEKKITSRVEFYKGYLLYIKFSYEMDYFTKEIKKSVCHLHNYADYISLEGIEIKSSKIMITQ